MLLESDLVDQFGIAPGAKDKVARRDYYDWLSNIRLLKHKKQCHVMGDNLTKATEKDEASHKYFECLLACNTEEAKKEFENLYWLMKKAPMPSSMVLDIAFAIDITGSMTPYSNCVVSTIESLVMGQNSILELLKGSFPEIEFKVRVGCLGFRDISDKNDRFNDAVWSDGGHFTENIANALQCIKSMCLDMRGGGDIAEDHIGAIQHCSKDWNHSNDWTSSVKCLMIFTDAPSHGLGSPLLSGGSNYDSYPTLHPEGLLLDDAILGLVSKDIDVFFCSFDPPATARTEEELLQSLIAHPDNKSDRGITRIPMVPNDQQAQITSSSSSAQGRHIIFVLDESGSMDGYWAGVVEAYQKYISKRKESQSDSDLVSVVQFSDGSRITVQSNPLSAAPTQLSFGDGGTCFHPAAIDACNLARGTPSSHVATIVFMSDGEAGDASSAAREFSVLNGTVSQMTGQDLELHVIAFGSGASRAQLQQIASASKNGKVHASANTADLASVFVSIASNQNVATLVEAEIVKRMSDAVSDKLSLEYFGS